MMNENFKNIVISIPASNSIDLIYKYLIHAHPDKIGYGYKDVGYYTFRREGGVMDKFDSLVKNGLSISYLKQKK